MSKRHELSESTLNHLEFLLEMHTSGVPIGEENIDKLKKSGFIKDEIPEYQESDYEFHKDQRISDSFSRNVDSDIVISNAFDESVLSKEDFDYKVKSGAYIFDGDREISSLDWMPKSKVEHSKEFVEFIDSLLFKGFNNRKFYKPLALHVHQSRQWLSDKDSIINYSNPEDRYEYQMKELRRCKENTLYFLDKYLYVREGSEISGYLKYDAKPVHEIICFLFDCGYNMYIGKPRQIAASTTLGGCALKRMLFNKNYFIKFITMDKESGVEIFEDKMKGAFSILEDWMKPVVSNSRDNLFKLGSEEKKGTSSGVQTKFQVVAPSVTAITGGAPNLIMVDEAAYINFFSAMIKEILPTLFKQSRTGVGLEMKNQLISWSTGGGNQKMNKAFEAEFMAAVKAFQERDFNYGIVPVFFDWQTRMGITQEEYNKQKSIYYAVEGPNKQESRIKFAQAYPSSIQDMFLTTTKTIVDHEFIDLRLNAIRNLPHDLKPKKGYFQPIFDTNYPASENSDVPYKIIDVEFIPTSDDNEAMATVSIFMEPKREWRHRYYQGTDPISSDTGVSNMASAIWDNYYMTTAAQLDYREQDSKYVFLQTMLLGMYYSPERGRCVKELVEANIGSTYRDYKDEKGHFYSMVLNSELPISMQSSYGNLTGLDNRAGRTRLIISRLHELASTFGDRIYIDTFWQQLKTFTCKISDSGNEKWESIDKKYYKDDVVFSQAFAYICSLSYEHIKPVEVGNSENKKYKTRWELVREKDYSLVRKPVRRPI